MLRVKVISKAALEYNSVIDETYTTGFDHPKVLACLDLPSTF
jgi:hypothetical protein